MRYRLTNLAGLDISTAHLVMPLNSRRQYLQEEYEGKATQVRNPGPYGDMQVMLVQWPDSLFDPARATWTTRNGAAAWSGGSIDHTTRQAKIQAFMQDAPSATRTLAEHYLTKP
jgi:hypothetical protein